MHVPDHGTHHRVKFRCKMSLYAPWTKMTNFWHEMRSKNMNLRSGNLSFLPRTHTMTFRSDISQGGACHGQVRAWFFSEFFEKFWKTKFAPQKSGSKCSREPRRISGTEAPFLLVQSLRTAIVFLSNHSSPFFAQSQSLSHPHLLSLSYPERAASPIGVATTLTNSVYSLFPLFSLFSLSFPRPRSLSLSGVARIS
jgi:hypothetical protein